MTPARSSMRTRRRQGEGERPTLAARSARLMRPSVCSRPRILRSTASSRCGMKNHLLGFWLAGYANPTRNCDRIWRPLPSRRCDDAAMAKPPTRSPKSSAPPAADALALLRALERKVLWLAAWTIHHANHLRPSQDGLKVGGHQASSASLATIMTALYFAVLKPQDRVAVKPHASPNFHAIQYLLGRQTREKLEGFRGYKGAQSYPSRTKDVDDVDFSTGSVGLGVAQTLFSSLTQDYVRAHGGAGGRRRARRGQHLRGHAGRLEAGPAQLLVGDRLQSPEPRRGGARGIVGTLRKAVSRLRLGRRHPEARLAAAGRLRGTGRRAPARLDRQLPQPALFGPGVPGRRGVAQAAHGRPRRPGRRHAADRGAQRRRTRAPDDQPGGPRPARPARGLRQGRPRAADLLHLLHHQGLWPAFRGPQGQSCGPDDARPDGKIPRRHECPPGARMGPVRRARGAG